MRHMAQRIDEYGHLGLARTGYHLGSLAALLVKTHRSHSSFVCIYPYVYHFCAGADVRRSSARNTIQQTPLTPRTKVKLCALFTSTTEQCFAPATNGPRKLGARCTRTAYREGMEQREVCATPHLALSTLARTVLFLRPRRICSRNKTNRGSLPIREAPRASPNTVSGARTRTSGKRMGARPVNKGREGHGSERESDRKRTK